MDTLHGPTLTDVVTIVVPQREQLQARVHDTASTWIDLLLLSAPRTSWAQITRMQVSVQFAGAQGLCRIMGHLAHRPQDAHLRVVGYGTGETLRFEHRGHIQLLRRPALVSAQANARIVVLRSGARDHVAVETRCVAIGGAELRLAGLPFAAAGQTFGFDLFLDPREPAVSGELLVERRDADGFVRATLSRITAHDRSRLVHWAAEHSTRRVA
ncbi:hypothetical protein [Paraconexibacter sp. AEG42_29]|uniref:hypothetical protein n=1 Tax=Paraconexibacter sp. AEG42_29 TaxID=2997339 RepID=UPI00339D3CF8